MGRCVWGGVALELRVAETPTEISLGKNCKDMGRNFHEILVPFWKLASSRKRRGDTSNLSLFNWLRGTMNSLLRVRP